MTVTDLVGRTLGGRYALTREIGRGGMGVVFEGIQVDLGRRVAIKVLLDADSRALARFSQEALGTAGISSPHIVRVTDYQPARGDEPPFIVMDLVEGPSLASLLASERTLAPGRAVAIAIQMLRGLAAAHAQGIIHRDVKPSNVLVSRVPGDKSDHVTLVDFGIAKLLHDQGALQTTVGSVLGTPAYLAPEQLLGVTVDARTDIHAVGLCLYQMLTGSRPFTGAGAELAGAIMKEVPQRVRQLRPELPVAIEDVVARAVEKLPEARFASATEMIDALESAMAVPLVLPAATAPVVAPLPPRAVFGRVLLATLIVGLVAFGALAAGMAIQAGKTVTTATPAPPLPSPDAPSASTLGDEDGEKETSAPSAPADATAATDATSAPAPSRSAKARPAPGEYECDCMPLVPQPGNTPLCPSPMLPTNCRCYSRLSDCPLCVSQWDRAGRPEYPCDTRFCAAFREANPSAQCDGYVRPSAVDGGIQHVPGEGRCVYCYEPVPKRTGTTGDACEGVDHQSRRALGKLRCAPKKP